MAKSPRAAQTRIAATVTARYYPSSGAADSFYLDGRITGRREHRAADITLDREDRGFFYSVFAHLAGSAPDDASQARVRKALDKIHADVHQPGRNIDNEINELAECAVSVTGRITLQHDGVRQPYFAGVMVRDSELAAVTMGSGCAYLYRGDVLYPLTADDFPIDAIDGNGKPVQGIDVYCAGVAGTVRYSNIAQLQLDDCIILCNREIMDALGQREVLRMLYEAEDQADAAGLIMTAASAKLPGVPMQFLIGFVESITPVDRTSRLSLGRVQADTYSPAPASHTASHTANAAPVAVPPDRSEERKPVSKPAAPVIQEDDEEDFLTLPTSKPGRASADNLKKAPSRHEAAEADYEDLDDYDDEPDNAGRGRRIAFYAVIVIICIGCLYAIYQMLFGGSPEPTQTTVTTAPSISTTTTGLNSSETTIEGSGTTSETTPAGTTAPTTTVNNTGMKEHVVVAGDTLYQISIDYYGEYSENLVNLIMEANNLSSGDNIFVGQVLKIPPKP